MQKLSEATEFICGILKYNGLKVLDPWALHVECPGKSRHSTPNKDTDCKALLIPGRIRLHCFHQQCSGAVARANARLDRFFSSLGSARKPSKAVAANPGAATDDLRQKAADAKQRILKDHCWPYAAIAAESPEPIIDNPLHHWRYILCLFAPQDEVWIGESVYSSGKELHRVNFRPASRWLDSHVCPGMFICPNAFKPGSYSRAKENVLARKFLVVESDMLDRDQVGAIFRWLEREKHMRLRAVVDSAGKSLHGWFDYPPEPLLEELKIVLPELGCDPALFRANQPCRLPGASREGNRQKLIYIKQLNQN